MNNVDILIFVAKLSFYDEVMWEDSEANSMIDQIELFEKTINHKKFNHCVKILFLNGIDLFEEKIKKIPITICKAFESFNGNTTSYHETITYITNIFTNCYKNNGLPLQIYETNATDTAEMKLLLKGLFA